MINANDHLKASIARVEQLKNQKKSKERREREAKRKADARRHFAFGRLVDKYLPGEEPAAFENLLRILVSNEDFLSKLKEDAVKLT